MFQGKKVLKIRREKEFFGCEKGKMMVVHGYNATDTPRSLTYLVPQNNIHGCQLVYFDPLNAIKVVLNKDTCSNSSIFFMYVLVSYKDGNNQMKHEGARVVTTLNSYILDAQWQLTNQRQQSHRLKTDSCQSHWGS